VLNELKDEFGFLATFVRALPPGPSARNGAAGRNEATTGGAQWGAIRSREIAELGSHGFAEGRDPA